MSVYIGTKKISSKDDLKKLSSSEKKIYDKLGSGTKAKVESGTSTSKKSDGKTQKYSYEVSASQELASMEVTTKDTSGNILSVKKGFSPSNRTKKEYTTAVKSGTYEDNKSQPAQAPASAQQVYFTPERATSPQETMQRMTELKKEPVPVLSKQIPQSNRANMQSLQDTQDRQEQTTQRQQKATYKFDIKHPIQSLRKGADIWESELNIREKKLYSATKQTQEIYSDAYSGMLDLSKSTQSIEPSAYREQVQNYANTIQSHQTGIKAPIVATAGTVFIQSAKGLKFAFVDTPLHPVETAKGFVSIPFELPSIIKNEASEISKNPIGRLAYLSSSLWGFSKLTKGAMRVIQPKVTEIPVKAENIKTLKTMRIDAEGKVKSDLQIQIETTKGKPKERYFWEDKKVKPRQSINIELDRKTQSDFKGAEVLEGSSQVQGRLFIKDKKVKIQKDTVTESAPPQRVYNLDMAESGKTASGVKLSGETGKLKEVSAINISLQSKKGFYYDDVFVSVKPSSRAKVQAVSSQTYRTKLTEGNLILEESMSGKFVKRKYERQPKKAPQTDMTTGVYSEGEFFSVKLDKSNMQAILKDAGIQTLESGKKVKLGETPIRTEIKAPQQDLSFQASKSGVIQELMPESKGISQTASQKPVIDVISINENAKGVSIYAPQNTKGFKFLPKAKQELILETEYKNMDKGKNKEKIKPDFDSFDSKSDTFFSSFFDSGSESGNKGRQDFRSRQDLFSPEMTEIFNPKDDTTQTPIIDRIPKDDIKMTSIFKPMQDTPSDFIQDRFAEPTEETITEPSMKNPLMPYTKDEKEQFWDELFIGYDVFVKEKGQFRKLNLNTMTETDALKFGSEYVKGTPSATFRLAESQERIKTASLKDKVILDQFYEKDGTYIEKSKYRIDTAGELSGITALGNMAKKTKSFVKDANRSLPKMMSQFAVPTIANNNKKGKGVFSW